MKLKSTLLYITAATLTFSSCQIGKHYTRPELNLPEQLDSTQQDTLTIAEMQWWEIYTDTTLQNLIDKTLEHNKDIKMAAARVKELAAMKRIDFANLFPQLNGSVYTQKEASNYGGDKYSNDPETGAKATVSWEVDLWGNLRWAKDKSMADFLGSIEAQRALKMSLIAEVAQAYFELVALDNELAIVKQTLNAREEGVRLAKIRFEGGLTSETSYQQAQVEYARTATLVPDLERKISIKENDIAFLAGEYPKQIERSIMPDEVKLPESLPIGLPSTLLERRPDVRQAEMELAQAFYATNAARAAFYPNITLSGTLGWTNNGGGVIVNPGQWLLNAIGSLTQPLFNRGTNIANLKIAKSRQEEAKLLFRQSLLNAGKEVNDALTAWQTAKSQIEINARQVETLCDAVRKTESLMRHSNATYLEVLTAQQSLLEAEVQQLQTRFERIQSVIKLYHVLGGGM